MVKTKPVILLAEDSPNDQFLLRRALNQMGIEIAIVTVSDGQAVMEYLKGEDLYADRIAYPIPTMLILDWSLPKMNGLAVLRQMKGHSDWQKICVVILSGWLDPEVAIGAVYVLNPRRPRKHYNPQRRKLRMVPDPVQHFEPILPGSLMSSNNSVGNGYFCQSA